MKITKKQLEGLTDVLVEVFSSIDDIFTKHPEVRYALDDSKINKAVQYITKLEKQVKEKK